MVHNNYTDSYSSPSQTSSILYHCMVVERGTKCKWSRCVNLSSSLHKGGFNICSCHGWCYDTHHHGTGRMVTAKYIPSANVTAVKALTAIQQQHSLSCAGQRVKASLQTYKDMLIDRNPPKYNYGMAKAVYSYMLFRVV